MSRNPLKLKIAYLYPDVLYGESDIANLSVFIQRAQQRDIEVQLAKIQRNDRILSSKYDFYYIGGTNTEEISKVQKVIYQNREELHVAMMSSVPMLAVGCGYMLFGKSFQLFNNVEMDGAKLLDVRAHSKKERDYNPICGYCDFLNEKTIVGFKNWGVDHVLGEDALAFLTLRNKLKCKGNKVEGIRRNYVIATSITSPILAQNPHLCDFFITSALRTKYKCNVPLTPLYDDIEWFSHKFMLDLK